MNVDRRTREPCDCELPGYFHRQLNELQQQTA